VEKKSQIFFCLFCTFLELEKNNCLIRGGKPSLTPQSTLLLGNNNEHRTNVFQKAIKFSLLQKFTKKCLSEKIEKRRKSE
jgi:hypothetical protein